METVEVIVVGGGPSGLAASLTLASEGRSVILLEKQSKAGGQAGTSSLIENFPPFPAGFSGSHFTDNAVLQCEKFGAGIEYNTEVQGVIPVCDGTYAVYTNHGIYYSRSILLALGLENRRLGIPGEDLPGVHHGMLIDPGEDVSDRHVVLVGGGNSVGQAAEYYLGAGAQVTIIARRPLEETMSAYLLKRISKQAVVFGDELRSIKEFSWGLELDLYPWSLGCHRLHIFVGQAPTTNWLRGVIKRTKEGYILTNSRHQTSRSGVFAVGDVVAGSVHRVACAVGAGNSVVPQIHAYLDANPYVLDTCNRGA